MTPVHHQIIGTLLYYDIFDFPLQKEEIRKCLMKVVGAYSVSDTIFEDTLRELCMTHIDILKGFYVLKGRHHLVPLRLERQRIARERWRRARRVVRLLSLIPTIEGIFVSGSLAFENTHELSDIDLLIVARQGRIWLTRLLALALVAMLGLRRTKHELIAPGRICLNHFIAVHDLHIPLHNLYNAQTYINLVPLYRRHEDLYVRFLKANRWITAYVQTLPFAEQYQSTTTQDSHQGFFIGAWFERLARWFQCRRIIIRAGVEVSDDFLAFHPDSQAISIEKEYLTRLHFLLQ